MKRYSIILAIGVATVLTLLSGYVHGRLSRRWGAPEIMKNAGAQLQELPAQVGEWTRGSSAFLARPVQQELESTGGLTCVYNKSGHTIAVTVIVGPPGKIAAHTPDVCLSSQDFTPVGTTERIQVVEPGFGGPVQTLWAETFKGKRLNAATERFYWGWSDGGPWSAPDSRWHFVGSPLLYKIQLSRVVDTASGSKVDELTQGFLREFLPVLRRQMETADAPQ
jgi:hypothetical protein